MDLAAKPPRVGPGVVFGIASRVDVQSERCVDRPGRANLRRGQSYLGGFKQQLRVAVQGGVERVEQGAAGAGRPVPGHEMAVAADDVPRVAELVDLPAQPLDPAALKV